MKTILITDSCSDLPVKYIEENNITCLPLTYTIDNGEFVDDLGASTSYHDFYEELRSGKVSTTSQINSNTFYEAFKENIANGNSVIYIGFSGVLSGCVNSARIAKEQILEENSEACIDVIDSKSASLGLGLLVYYANELIKSGKSHKDVVNWIESNKLKLNHWFTVEDLNHLKRGGRVSQTAATIGTLLNIKPVLHVDNEGRLIPIYKVKGRKKSLKLLFEKLDENIVNPEENVIAISHGDSIEDADYVKSLILEKYKVKDIIINNIGPVIGSHAGPGTIALFFMGDKR